MAQDLAVFDELLAEVTVAVRPILEIQVTSPDSERIAQMAGGQVAALLKEVERRRKDLIAPLRAQIATIDAAAEKVKGVLAQPDQHIRGQLNAYAAEAARQRQEALRIQREREEMDRKVLEEKRRTEEAEFRAKQDEERRAREAKAAEEQRRIQAELEAQQMKAAAEAAAKKAAADLFGGTAEAQAKADREALEAKLLADQKAARERQDADDRAERERRALEEQQERERIAEHARIQREESERAQAAEAERKAIEAQRVKGAKTEVVVEIVDAWAVPREFLKDPLVRIADVQKAYKAGRREIPGLRIREETKVALRSQMVGTLAEVQQ
jgi:colicin import membrane protein